MNRTLRPAVAAVVLLCCAGLAACTTAPDAPREICNAGTYARCTCADGRSGEAACNLEGTAFEPCACEAPTCLPGSVALCACTGGAVGHAVCNEQGSAYGTCGCAPAPACTPNSLAVCACGDGKSGTATCREDGSGYGSCACPTPLLCVPTSLAACACPDGGSGQATCALDGSGFGPCDCSAPPVCAPQSSVSCTCPDGRPGRSSCNAEGTGFGECACEFPPACAPGTAVTCRCGDAGTGLMTCNAEGTGYDACRCDFARVCSPGSTLSCACGDGGTGQATCNAQGTGYGACDCAARICTPSGTTACACSAGEVGRAYCTPQGTSWSACSCSVPRTCLPRSLGICECADGRRGQAQCNETGDRYEPCRCDGCEPGNVAVCGCSGSSATGMMLCGDDGEYGGCRCDARVCFPGELALCDCDGGMGAQACNTDGTGFLPCQCGAPLTCVPDSKAACSCADGKRGQATCSAAGDGFGPCDCSGAQCTPGARQVCTCEGGMPGIATCSEDGAAFGACTCEPPCGLLRASGVLHTSDSDVSAWGFGVTSAVTHRQDADSDDDGCVGEAKLTIGGSRGCTLNLEFGSYTATYSSPSPYGGLRKIAFTADSYCPGFSGGNEGTYSSSVGFFPGWYEGPRHVSERFASSACFRSASLRFPDQDFTLARSDGRLLTLNLKDLALTGDLASAGSATLACAGQEVCEAPMYDGGGGWCVPPCGPYEWSCTLRCAAGFRDGGDRTCVAEGTCSSGYWDDGQGKCLPAGTCAPGYHDDGTGVCTMLPGCITGYHDGGDGNCVPEGECSPTFGQDPFGYCKRWVHVAPPTRPSNYNGFTAAVRLGSGKAFALSSTLAQLFDPSTRAWSTAAAPPVTRNRHQALALEDDRVFVLGLAEPYNGYGTLVTNVAMVYDGAAGTWTTAPAPGQPERTDPCSTLLRDGTILVVGGHQTEQQAEIFDPATKTWQFAGALSLPRRSPGCTLLPDGRVLVCGGSAQQQDCSYYSGCATRSCEVFDPTTKGWKAAGQMRAARAAPWLAPLGPATILVGGTNQTLELYDVATGTSAEFADGPSYGRLLLPMTADRVFMIASRPYLIEKTAAATPLVRDIGPLLNPPEYSRAVGFENGRILVFDQDSAELFIGGL